MFVKGQSGNPAGKAAIPEELKAKLKDGFAEAVEFWFKTMRDESIQIQYRDKAAEKIAFYAYGKPRESIDIDHSGSIDSIKVIFTDKCPDHLK